MISHVDKKWYPHVWDLINYLYWFATTQYTTKFYILIKQCLMVWRATVCGFNQSFAYLTGRGKGRIVIFEGIELLMLKVTFKHIKVHSLLQSTWSANHTALKKTWNGLWFACKLRCNTQPLKAKKWLQRSKLQQNQRLFVPNCKLLIIHTETVFS